MSLTAIADDIYQLKLPLPFALNIVNVYLLHGANGWTIVDTGINTAAGRSTWLAAFDELGIKPIHIEQIVLTHVHPDHYGMSGWLQELGKGAGHYIPVKTSPLEDKQADDLWKGREEFNFGQWLHANGMPENFAHKVGDSMINTLEMTYPHPDKIEHIYADTTFRMGARDFQLMHAPGHSDGQLMFYDVADKLLLSGDHVLMKITPNIGLWTNTAANPLGRFLESLRSVNELDVRQALPGHKALIDDWQGRIAELITHHDHRLNFVLEALDKGQHTPYLVAEYIFPTDRFSPHEWRFAIAETLAHLEYLQLQGQIMFADGRYTCA